MLDALLLSLCRRRTEPFSDRRLVSPLEDTGQWRAFVDFASRHRLLGLSLAVLERSGCFAPDTPRGHEIGEMLRRLRRRSAGFAFARDRICETLAGAGLDVVVLKGAASAEALYTDPVERDLRDLDLLVGRGDLERSIEIMGSMGFTGPPSRELFRAYLDHHFHLPMWHNAMPLVELHWGLAKQEWLFDLAPGDVLERAERCEGEGTALPVPCVEHQLLHLVLQNLQEGFSRLSRAVEVDRLVASGRVDWELLVDQAERGNLRSATAVTLQTAARFLGTPLPADGMRALTPGPVSRFFISAMRPQAALLEQRFERSFTTGMLLQLWLLRGSTDRMRMLGRSLQPTLVMAPEPVQAVSLGQRILRLGKLAALQTGLTLRGLLSQVTATGRDQMRFWSSQAKSSERL